MSIQPQGEDLRKAVKYISERRLEDPDVNIRLLLDEACHKFDLKPTDAEFLERTLNKPDK